MGGFIHAVPDVDKLQRIDDPGCQMWMNQMIEMAAPCAALFDKAMRAQQGKMLGYTGGRQIKPFGDAADILFALPQILDYPQPIRVRQQLEQVGQFARHDDPAGHKHPLHLQVYAAL